MEPDNIPNILNVKRSRTKTAIQLKNLPKKIQGDSPRQKMKENEKFCIADYTLSQIGFEKVQKAQESLFGLLVISDVNKNSEPLKGVFICGCTHINEHSAILIQVLLNLGATLSWCTSNVNTVDDDICAYLATNNVSIFAWNGEIEDDYWWCVNRCIEEGNNKVDFIVDEGGDLSQIMQTKHEKNFNNLKGIIESSSYGIYKLYSMVRSQQLLVPAMNICNSITLEHFTKIFQFRECLMKCFEIANEPLLSGKKILICGYGHRGKGCSKYLRLMGATVYVTEIDPICSIQACTDGIEVVDINSVIGFVDGIILCTENTDIVTYDQIEQVKTNCLIINYGHSSRELNFESIKSQAANIDISNPNYMRITLRSKKVFKILFNGEPVQGVSFPQPSIILSLQYSTIVVAILELNLFSRNKYNGGVYLLPRKLDEYIAQIHLKHFSAFLTKLNENQYEFLGVTKEGPFKSAHYRY